MKKQIEVVGAVVIRDGTVLAARRGPQMSLAGQWEFPGGKIEAGERAEDALVREMLEELLCTVRIGKHVATTTHEYDFGVVRISTFYATLIGAEPRRTEHSEIRWIPIPHLRSVEWAPADVPTVERIMCEHANRQTPDK
ncbi:(deoxy)nucleoside triphosphate pyrophosphohydrolase [Microbacterium sp. MYb64]|uniref:(deoxy)nucleoside triphosphate pyrophosphohydrolase n=1 Tax=Microbacterium sp. MYb64 TaxID=1848691 RepID=UPI000CFC5C4A|nr:(deoxy)nucleoside triphosphate pyrophosphohydrolase [Microbacterium sp. MYb64]PRB07045.1 8-oxo-dGTP diphosphatase MutT [Microbacterium sp. MYb64]